MPLLGGFAIPLHRLGVVLRDTPAFVIHEAEVVLGISISLIRRLAIPLHRLGVVLRDTPASAIHETEIGLG